MKKRSIFHLQPGLHESQAKSLELSLSVSRTAGTLVFEISSTTLTGNLAGKRIRYVGAETQHTLGCKNLTGSLTSGAQFLQLHQLTVIMLSSNI